MRAEIIKKRDLIEKGLAHEDGHEKPLAEIVEAFLVEVKATRATATRKRIRQEFVAARAFLGSRRVRDVTVGALMEWRRKRMLPRPPKRPGEKERPGLSVRTINLGASILKACLEWGRRAGLITVNPLADLRPLANPDATK